MKRLLLALTMVLVLPACYHATVETGLPPGAQTIDNNWAHGFFFGLVPPSTVETMERCPNGVARVETQLSFLNQVVSAITLNLYTPMQINVTCAASGMTDGEDIVDSKEEFEKALEEGGSFLVRVR